MKRIVYIIILLIFSCTKENSLSNQLHGLWEHDNILHKKISMEFDNPMGNLSGPNAFGIIKMFFNENDNTYISYFDNLEYKGEWKIENNLLYMKRVGEKWGGFEFRLYEDNLVIIDREWLMTFIKNKKEVK